MPAKSTSHEAAMRKVWKAEIKTLDSSRHKVTRDFNAARGKLVKAAQAAAKKLTAFDKRAAKQQPRALANIDRRVGILNGKLGL